MTDRMKLSVREMLESDIPYIVDYFVNADADFLKGMGADKNKLPGREEWIQKLGFEYGKPYAQKEFYYIIWLMDGIPVGHSNVNAIVFGQSAVMHLHLWTSNERSKGLGSEFLKRSIPYYFKNLKLEHLVCEPSAVNQAPNQVLQKIGFTLVRSYDTTPGWINFHQTVNRFELTREEFERKVLDKREEASSL